MAKILVTYATMAGSTAEVAAAIAEEIAARGLEVDVRPLDQVGALDGYSAVVAGGPMIMGWHRQALRFLKSERRTWQRIPLALFITAISLTGTAESGDVPLYLDEQLPKAPARPDRLSLRERYARAANYTRPLLRAVRPARPVSIAIFGGWLEYGRLPWWAVLFVMLIIKAPAGDRRNWPAIRGWAATLPELMQLDVTAPLPSPETV